VYGAMDRKFFQRLGLCYRAGKLVHGEEAVLTAMRKGKVQLVFIAADASENTKKRLMDKCAFYQIPYHVTADRASLGAALGKESRVVIGVTDRGFADLFLRDMSTSEVK